MKRTDYINWDEYFMGIALLTAMRSKDPNSQVGACIVSPENKILSLGYNGMPIGCDDDAMPWEREGDPLDTKYMYVCHAELNAILNSAHNNLKGARVYVTLFPCNECAKAIIQSGISEVVYYGDKYHDFRFQRGGAVHVQKGRRAPDRLHPQRAEGTAGAVRGAKPLPKLSLENTVYSLYNRTTLSNKYTFYVA